MFWVLLGIMTIPCLIASCQPGKAQALVSYWLCQPDVDVWEILVSNVKPSVCKQLNLAADLWQLEGFLVGRQVVGFGCELCSASVAITSQECFLQCLPLYLLWYSAASDLVCVNCSSSTSTCQYLCLPVMLLLGQRDHRAIFIRLL